MFARSAICDAVTAVCDRDVSIATIATIQAGNNHAYYVALENDGELLVKVGTRFPDSFPAEPETMARVHRETQLPVPRVHGTGTDPFGYPFAVYEYVPTVDVEWLSDLSPSSAEQLCREAGRNLSELHQITFPRYGRVGLAGDSLTVVDPTPYREMLRHSLERQLSRLEDSPFERRCRALETLGTELVETIDLEGVNPTLVHGDYRLDNLCLDPTAERITTAILDWELPTAADPLWDAVATQALLVDGYRLDPDVRDSLKTAFWGAYGNSGTGTARRRCYELLARIRLARHLETEMGGTSDSALAARIAEHEDAFDALLAER